MITLGVDLSVNLEDTGVCLLEWRDGRVISTFPRALRSDEELLDLVGDRGDAVGIDVPLGWPRGFADAVGRYMAGPTGRWTAAPGDFSQAYHRLRETDKVVAARGRRDGLKINPMSVAADKLGAPAMKAAWMLSELARRDHAFAVDRSGVDGRIIEVYPAAAIQVWDLSFASYRNKSKGVTATALAQCRAELRDRAGFAIEGLDAMRTEHQFDALLCALVARAARLDLTSVPVGEQFELAVVEGWIHVPTRGSLRALAPEHHGRPWPDPAGGGTGDHWT